MCRIVEKLRNADPGFRQSKALLGNLPLQPSRDRAPAPRVKDLEVIDPVCEARRKNHDVDRVKKVNSLRGTTRRAKRAGGIFAI